MTTSNRLDNIADRQRRSRLLDVMFAALMVVAGAASITGVSSVVRASHAQVANR